MKIFAITASIILLAVITVIAVTLILLRKNVARPKHDPVLREDNPFAGKHYGRIKRGIDYYNTLPKETVYINSRDGLKLAAELITAENPRAAVVLMHGFHSSAEIDFSCVFEYYREHNITMLVPYQRASGKSEGEYITYGIKERFDCCDWAYYLAERFPSLPIVYDGVSLGAATVLMASGEKNSENVSAVIADCGFTSPYEIMRHVLKLWYHLPEYPLMPLAAFLVRRIAGFGLKEYSTVEAMKTNALPILFAHGLSDTFVPPEMTLKAYAACKTKKHLITVENAGHAMSFLENEEEYTAIIDRLFDDVCRDFASKRKNQI